MEYNEIIGLMQEMESTGLTRIKIEQENFKLLLEKNITNTQSRQSSVADKVITDDLVMSNLMADGAMSNSSSLDSTLVKNTRNKTIDKKNILETKKILSPMVGTFYGQPGPDKPPYVKVGDMVKKGQTVCIIEAMKLMNEIESEVEGEIIECLVENEDMVEFGQPLFIVK